MSLADKLQANTLVPEVYFSTPLRNENNKNKPLEPGYQAKKQDLKQVSTVITNVDGKKVNLGSSLDIIQLMDN
jgi:hypothetical protein